MHSWADDSASLELFDTCNANCSCDGVLFEPVCSHDKLQYYSPCHAGCSYRNKTDGSNYVSNVALVLMS